jgi:hypothetical protein
MRAAKRSASRSSRSASTSHGRIGDGEPVNEDGLLSVQRNVCGFVEEAAPEDVLPAVTETELEQRLGRSEPSYRSVRARALEVSAITKATPASAKICPGRDWAICLAPAARPAPSVTKRTT